MPRHTDHFFQKLIIELIGWPLAGKSIPNLDLQFQIARLVEFFRNQLI